LREKAEQAGLRLNYFEYPDMFHGWMIGPFREAKQATAQIVEILARAPRAPRSEPP
jgi:acetyl esterase/lipase